MTAAPRPSASTRVADLPIVFMSFDEPWAELGWQDLKAKAPHAKRVHGVAGLDACHKAAARAAEGEWFISVDADTIIDPAFLDVRIPRQLLNRNFRLQWHCRNKTNGLVSGNGSLKLWPTVLANKMRTHEAAPDTKVSIDHEIDQIVPGQSMGVQMPGCYSVTNPAQTPYHAFRSGFREGVLLGHLLIRQISLNGQDSPQTEYLMGLLRIWCSLGRQAENGLWLIYGARLGLRLTQERPDWDLRNVNSYAWLWDFWRMRVHPRFVAGGAQRGGDNGWSEYHLAAECRLLKDWINAALPVGITDYSAEESALLVESGLFSPRRPGALIDALGYRFVKGAGAGRDIKFAREAFETASVLGNAAAFNNLARLHETEEIEGASRDEAERLYRVATELGSRYAPYHLAQLWSADATNSRARKTEIARLLKLARKRGFDPGGAADK